MKVWTLTSRGQKRFEFGHPWVFSNELTESPKGLTPGELVELRNLNGQFLAYGQGNPHSLICFRLMSKVHSLNFSDSNFIVQKLLSALNYRIKVKLDNFSFRLCFSEADELPGIIIERYLLTKKNQQAFVIQLLTAGAERLLNDYPDFIQQFVDKANTLGLLNISWDRSAVIIKRNSKARLLEGLEVAPTQVIWNPQNENFKSVQVEIQEVLNQNKSISFNVDLLEGQKTGFFLDQFNNISQLIRYLHFDKNQNYKTLDLFCYVGQWSAQLATYFKSLGSKHHGVLVDASQEALDLAKMNLENLGSSVELNKMNIISGLENLPSFDFDVVICDPPALIKSKKDIQAGKSGYVKVNSEALKRVKNGGYFVSCSCSQHLSEEDLIEVLNKAQKRAKKKVRWFARGWQSPDHPQLSQFPQGQYLKSFIGIVEHE